eukprot:CAMPEP_0119133720 /NCGR_PEP_ID=MMETSP1310-20130426/13520_1 /TAXON_ID=464262 /ORGANISM="Genus nov. species nov., Strain RCC2339" /LENGTH=142 /DNA_ID=CAMNT_0007124421 /DNA_START=158 /DNA_END=583 /DNA_ORIENTATION=-
MGDINFFTLLKDEELCPMFEAWLKEDFSYENFSFWKDVEDFKANTPDEDVEKEAIALYEKYFALGSEWEVNADHYQKLELKERIQAPGRDVFDDVQISIFVLMRMDSFPKFMESREFQEWNEAKQGPVKKENNSEGGRARNE